MSKTNGNVVSPLSLADDIGVDAFRYYLLAETPYGQDGDVNHEGVIRRYNSDLANNLGNLVSRVTTLVHKQCAGIGPAPGEGGDLARAAARAVEEAAVAWGAVAPSQALAATWSLISATNSHLAQRQPWKLTAGAEVNQILGDALEALRIAAILASPAVPETAQRIWTRIGLAERIQAERLPGAGHWGGYPGGLPVPVGEPLFPRRG